MELSDRWNREQTFCWTADGNFQAPFLLPPLTHFPSLSTSFCIHQTVTSSLLRRESVLPPSLTESKHQGLDDEEQNDNKDTILILTHSCSPSPLAINKIPPLRTSLVPNSSTTPQPTRTTSFHLITLHLHLQFIPVEHGTFLPTK